MALAIKAHNVKSNKFNVAMKAGFRIIFWAVVIQLSRFNEAVDFGRSVDATR